MIVSAGAGSGYDVYTRLLSRFITRYIPGEPRIVVQNMEGADGLTAINYVANVAAKDGSVMSDTYSTMPFYILLDGRNAKFDVRRLNWIGNISKALSVCVAWRDSPIKTFDDVVQKSMRVAATGASGWRSVLPRLLNLVSGTKFDVITGYSSNADFLAVERGEVDGSCTTFDTLMASKTDWINQKKVNFLAQFGDAPTPELPGVPLGLDRIANADDRLAMDLILSQQQTGRPFLMPLDVPADRVQAIRKAFDATMKDPEFIAAAGQANLWLAPTTAADIEAQIQKAYGASAGIVSHARDLLERAVKK